MPAEARRCHTRVRSRRRLREAAPPDLPRALASKVSHGRSFPAVRRELYSNEYNMLYVLWILGRLVKKLLLSDFRMTDIH